MAVFRVRLSQPGYRTGSNRGRSRTRTLTRTGKKTQGGSQSALDEPKRQSPLSFQTIRTTRTRARDEPRRYEITRTDSHRPSREASGSTTATVPAAPGMYIHTRTGTGTSYRFSYVPVLHCTGTDRYTARRGRAGSLFALSLRYAYCRQNHFIDCAHGTRASSTVHRLHCVRLSDDLTF